MSSSHRNHTGFPVGDLGKFESELSVSVADFRWLHCLVWDQTQLKCFFECQLDHPFISLSFAHRYSKSSHIHYWCGMPSNTNTAKIFVVGEITNDNFVKATFMTIPAISSSFDANDFRNVCFLLSAAIIKYQIDIIRLLDPPMYLDYPHSERNESKSICISDRFYNLKRIKIQDIEASQWWLNNETQDHLTQLNYLKMNQIRKQERDQDARHWIIKLFSLGGRPKDRL